MTDIANPSQFEAWNGDSGHRWVARADERDRVLAPVADTLLAAAAPAPGTRVLDVGCGCGGTTLRTAAQVGATGRVTGIDLSGPMLDVARRRAAAAGAVNTTFLHADAQTHGFEPRSIDLVISRFGTMFFSDPDAAFANIATSLVSAGGLCFATWQPLADNEWLAIPGAALSAHADLPESADGPGMFAQSDPAVVTAMLGAVGFGDITIDPFHATFTLGRTIDEAVDYLADTGPARVLLETIGAGPARDAALTDVCDALADRHDRSGVRLGGAIWLITATGATRSDHE